MAQHRSITDEIRPHQIAVGLFSLLALVVLGLQVSIPLDSNTIRILEYLDLVLCAIFALDFVAQLLKAQDRLKYMATWGWIDLLSSIPVIGILRLGRLARVVRLLRVLRVVRAGRMVGRLVLKHRRDSALSAAALVSIVMVAAASIAVLYVEPGNGNIKSAEDAIWWAIVTITTVGYGDKFPVSTEGRAIAVVLMATGVGLFGTLSGLVAGWFMSPQQSADKEEIQSIKSDIEALKAAAQDSAPPSH